MSRLEFPARFSIYLDPDTGEEFYLSTDTEIDQAMAIARADFDQRLAERRDFGETADAQNKVIQAFESGQKIERARQIRERDAAKAKAQEYNYTLVKPSYGEWVRIRAESTGLDTVTGQSNFNEERYKQLLLQNGGVKKEGRVLSGDEIESLPPLVARVLGFRLARSLDPDRKRLLFTLPPSGLTSPTTSTPSAAAS